MTRQQAETVAVLVGGALGTAARWAVDVLLPHRMDEFAVSTLLVNVLGSFLLGWLIARPAWAATTPWLRTGLTVGLLGTFTTFSAVSLSLAVLASGGQVIVAAGYLAATILLGLGAAGLALRRGAPSGGHT